MAKRDRPNAGERVVLLSLPPGLLDGLPDEDQRAIKAIVGKPVKFLGYDEIGRAELEFDDPFDPRTENYSHTHFIWVGPEFIRRYIGTRPAPAKRRRSQLDAKPARPKGLTGHRPRKQR